MGYKTNQNCPNCGAAVLDKKTKICRFCGTTIKIERKNVEIKDNPIILKFFESLYYTGVTKTILRIALVILIILAIIIIYVLRLFLVL